MKLAVVMMKFENEIFDFFVLFRICNPIPPNGGMQEPFAQRL